MTDAQRIARATIDAVQFPGLIFCSDEDGLNEQHIYNILQQVEAGEVTGDKAHRFIGWAQAVICTEGLLTLMELRDLNRSAIDETTE